MNVKELINKCKKIPSDYKVELFIKTDSGIDDIGGPRYNTDWGHMNGMEVEKESKKVILMYDETL